MRDQLTKYRKANAILQKLKPDKKKWIILVEGKSDRIFYGKFVLQEKVQVSSCDGCKNLLEIAEVLEERKIENFIGILDSDFRRLDNEEINDPKIFHTDYHDIEISILESRALQDVLNKYINEDRFSAYETSINQSFLKRVYELSSHLGYLKWANKIDNLGLVFKPERPEGKRLKFNKFIDERTLEYISDEALINYMIQYSNNRDTNVSTRDEIINSYETRKNVEDVDQKQLCNGHDMCQIISLSLKKVIGSNNVSVDTIEENLIFAYDSIAFKESNLHTELKAWEVENTQLFI